MNRKNNPLKQKILQFKAVIFDLDGTLVDSMWMWEKIDIEYLGRFGIPLPEKLQESIEGMSFSETAVYFKERFSLKDELDKIKSDWNAMACDKYRHEVPYKEGAENFLQFCKANGIKLGVATSNSRELVEHAAEALRLHSYMDCIMTACEVQRGKPAPDIYLAVADKLGVSPSDCLVFEDILPGIMAGKNAGMTTCAVADAYSEKVRTEKIALADYFIEDYSELL
ncbi:MAG: HAD family phosphatase [Lachnospiraceae bacterium]|nr:HAD family phosphatase [Lachnospiraceae bacterium]